MSSCDGSTEVRLGNGRMVEAANAPQRLVARFVDVLVVLPAVLVWVGSFVGASLAAFADGLSKMWEQSAAIEAPPSLPTYAWVALFVLVAYEPVTVAFWGATLGKRVAGVRVVRFSDGSMPGLWSSWVRVAAPAAFGLVSFCVGWVVVWVVLWTSMSQNMCRRGWHDRISDTIVVTSASLRGPKAIAERLEYGPSGGTGSAAFDDVEAAEPARLRARSWASMIDGLVAAPLVALAVLAVLAALSDFDNVHATAGLRLWDLLGVTARQWWPQAVVLLAAAMLAGPVMAALRGATVGMRIASIELSRASSIGGRVSPFRALMRLAVPRAVLVGVGAAGAWVAGVVAGDWWLAGGAGVGVAAWCVTHGSSLWGPRGRGWSDRLTGTIVSSSGDGGGPSHSNDVNCCRSHQVSKRGARRLIVVVASLCAGMAVAGALLGLDRGLGLGPLDLGEEPVKTFNVQRGVHQVPSGGDVCGYDDYVTVYHCELKSLGGLRWDTGYLGSLHNRAGYFGPGVLCLNAYDGLRCWEWGQDVQPRRARIPEEFEFSRLRGAEGFVCGQTIDRRRVVCWTTGVEHMPYRQVTHLFALGTRHSLESADDDPVSFGTFQRRTGLAEQFLLFFDQGKAVEAADYNDRCARGEQFDGVPCPPHL